MLLFFVTISRSLSQILSFFISFMKSIKLCTSTAFWKCRFTECQIPSIYSIRLHIKILHELGFSSDFFWCLRLFDSFFKCMLVWSPNSCEFDHSVLSTSSSDFSAVSNPIWYQPYKVYEVVFILFMVLLLVLLVFWRFTGCVFVDLQDYFFTCVFDFLKKLNLFFFPWSFKRRITRIS